jgi:hypothetical protein
VGEDVGLGAGEQEEELALGESEQAEDSSEESEDAHMTAGIEAAHAASGGVGMEGCTGSTHSSSMEQMMSEDTEEGGGQEREEAGGVVSGVAEETVTTDGLEDIRSSSDTAMEDNDLTDAGGPSGSQPTTPTTAALHTSTQHHRSRSRSEVETGSARASTIACQLHLQQHQTE